MTNFAPPQFPSESTQLTYNALIARTRALFAEELGTPTEILSAAAEEGAEDLRRESGGRSGAPRVAPTLRQATCD